MVAKKNFVFSTDSYHANSIKARERWHRGFYQWYIAEGLATSKSSDFKLYLANEENKMQLCKLLLQLLGSKAVASLLEKSGTAVVVVKGKLYQMELTDGDVC